MAGQSSTDLMQQTVDAFASKIQDYATGIAGRLGQPLSGQQLTRDEAVARWNFSPLGSTDAADAAYHQLVAQGAQPGQALAQVYPMRQMLIQGADINDSINTAKQIQAWAAEAAGQDVTPLPNTSTLPMLMAAQRMAGGAAQQLPPMPAAAPPSPLPPTGPPAGLPAAPLPPPPMPMQGAP